MERAMGIETKSEVRTDQAAACHSNLTGRQSLSSFAGNGLLISPCCLVSDGLLRASDCESRFASDVVQYDSIIPFKQRLLERAWTRFIAGERKDLWAAYDEFCITQANWLEDYALFRALKIKFDGAYYLEWPEELVQRSPDALVKARRELASQIDQFRLEQFLLLRQADQLKEHAHAKGVCLAKNSCAGRAARLSVKVSRSFF
jgi:4-alpha-glucanotransferase